MPEKDFSYVQFKVNVSGSWANLVRCPVGKIDGIKAACDVLAGGHSGAIRFKIFDADGGEIESFRPKNGRYDWCTP